MSAVWQTIGSYWVPFAEYLVGTIGGVGTHTLLSTVVFWSNYIPLYCFYRYLDHTGIFKQYKLHQGKMEPQSLNDKVVDGMRKGWWRGPPRTALMYYIFFYGRMNLTSFPSFSDMCINIMMAQVMNVTSFPSFSELSINIMTAQVSLINFDLFTWLVWLAVVNYLDHHVHCGYSFPFNPWNLFIDPEIHDWHHFQNAGSYATFPLFDWLFGTDRNFRAYKQRQLDALKKGVEDQEKENRLDVLSDSEEATGFC
ncbi:Methylsterol monooxygenase 2-2 [Gonapodya sp. JEL0774]|nr:Methylsterol monooxygenase 2-2 [Gonapodya sp. JEL0774]